ncbi:M48 family metalloprotease [Alphaproteobacteria bacterium]|nr:M48 family metalloprotease [Alphaproteobacteria bacterium]
MNGVFGLKRIHARNTSWFRPSLQMMAVGLVLSLGLSACTVGPGIDYEDQVRIGAENHPKIIAKYGGVYGDARVKAYVEAIMDRISKASDKPDQRYRITVLDTPIVNAFALPGGYTYVTRGLLALANSEAELAGVIGHEIAHVTAQHSAKRQSTAQGAAVLATILGAAIEANSGVNSRVTNDVIRLGGGALLAGYSREQEYEADNLGIQALARAGYTPHAQADFLESLGRYSAYAAGTKVRTNSGWFDSHPNTKDRVAKAHEKAEARKQPNSTEVGVARYLSVVDGLLYGDGVEQGVVKDRSFAHPELRIQFKVPSGFDITNEANRVIARHTSQITIIFDLAETPKGLGLKEYVADIWAPTGHVGGVKTTRIKGRAAAMGKVKTDTGTAHLLAIAYEDQKVFRFGVLAPTGQQANAEAAFSSLRANIRFLSQAAAKAIKPQRVTVITVQRGDTVASLAAMMQSSGNKKALFLVLNGLKEGDIVEPGQRLKLITS